MRKTAHKKITYLNGFRAVKALERVADDPRVEEIEGGGMDEGRVFIHLVKGLWFGPHEMTTCKSVGNAQEIKSAMSLIEEKPSEEDSKS